MKKKLRPVLLAGGSGTRLWPLSTKARPKQFIPIFKEFSLFDLSLQRLNKNNLFKKPIIVTSKQYLHHVEKSLLRTGVEADQIILEPEGKNTYAAIIMSVLAGLEKLSDESFLVTPSDHYMSTNKKFYETCTSALRHHDGEGLVLMGIKPERPSAEYGYIVIKDQEDRHNKLSLVKRFIEKPSLKKSKSLIDEPNVFWNSGMFIFEGNWLIEKLKLWDEEMLNTVSNSFNLGTRNKNIFLPDPETFKNIVSNSFDKGFVEKNRSTSMITLDAGWSDLGSWAALGALHKDPASDMTLYNEGSYVRTNRPWGYFETLIETKESKVKLLSISPGEKISLQKHKYRTETWYVIHGKALVTRDTQKLLLEEGDSIIIRKNQIHRLENKTLEPLQIIEVQTGTYFGEDDIIRMEDIYGRTTLH